ncbi:hypothetical protein PIB30_060658 [Stylosanthes scabra]|uniref:Uncharacterized protein n=1 Tax=Stylosanthes scabra TaxID=79078 RepID=A0ABU6UJE8_9FABA|nr:hypothetical protein [Stylosanthes scabra]
MSVSSSGKCEGRKLAIPGKGNKGITGICVKPRVRELGHGLENCMLRWRFIRTGNLWLGILIPYLLRLFRCRFKLGKWRRMCTLLWSSLSVWSGHPLRMFQRTRERVKIFVHIFLLPEYGNNYDDSLIMRLEHDEDEILKRMDLRLLLPPVKSFTEEEEEEEAANGSPGD